MRLATFDIFDTTLVRICGVPDAIFGLMAMELWPDSESSRTAFTRLFHLKKSCASEKPVIL